MAKDREDFLFKQQYGFSREFIAQTRKLFEPIAGKKLTDEECAVIAREAVSLELYLRKLQKKYKAG